MRYNGKTGWQKFGITIFWVVAILGLLTSIGFILNATIPEVHDFFVKCIDWIKDLFTSNEEIVEDTTEAVVAMIRK